MASSSSNRSRPTFEGSMHDIFQYSRHDKDRDVHVNMIAVVCSQVANAKTTAKVSTDGMTLTILNEWKHRNADDRLVGKSVRLDDAFSRAMLSHFAQSEPRMDFSYRVELPHQVNTTVFDTTVFRNSKGLPVEIVIHLTMIDDDNDVIAFEGI